MAGRVRTLSVSLSIAGYWAATAHAGVGDSPRIYGGEAATECQLPTTVAMAGPGALCTGTLVHPEVVLYAAHCQHPSVVVFGERSDTPARMVPVDHCDRFIEQIEVGPKDYAYCKLADPVLDMPIAPAMYGCETALREVGTPVVIAGFGETDEQLIGRKYWAQTEIVGLTQMVVIGQDGVSAWQGDSGGPAFMRVESDGSWRSIGIVSGGTVPGMPIQYVPVENAIGWVEESSGVDITPCFDADAEWEASSACGYFATAPLIGGTWDDGCSGIDPLSGPSATCGPPVLFDGDPPSVAITAPADGDRFLEDPSLVDVLVEADDSGTGIRRVTLVANGDPIGEDALAPFEFRDIELPAGSYTFVAVAEDKSGNQAQSEPVGVGVGDEEPPDTGDTETGGGAETSRDGCGCETDRTPMQAGLLLLFLPWLRRRRV